MYESSIKQFNGTRNGWQDNSSQSKAPSGSNVSVRGTARLTTTDILYGNASLTLADYFGALLLVDFVDTCLVSVKRGTTPEPCRRNFATTSRRVKKG